MAARTLPMAQIKETMKTTRARTPRRRFVVTACAALGVLASSLGVVPGLGAASVAPASPPSCTTSTTVIWLYIPAGSAAAGSSYFDVRFTNLSAHTCALGGHPGVSAVNPSGQQLGNAASFVGPGGPASVDLVKGATATSTLRITDVANFPANEPTKIVISPVAQDKLRSSTGTVPSSYLFVT